jgi:hypothetical protein
MLPMIPAWTCIFMIFLAYDSSRRQIRLASSQPSALPTIALPGHHLASIVQKTGVLQ